MQIRIPTALAALSLLSSCASYTTSPAPITSVPSTSRSLKVASWNLEFLAARNGVGCNPRASSDYEAMRQIAQRLDADVIAFQEAESELAASRVFDPARYTIVMETRAGAPSGTCGGQHPNQPFIRQAVGFAIRKGLSFERNADVTSLMLDNPQLRSGVDVTLRARGHAPLRLLNVHLKSGCFSGSNGSACPTLLRQIPALEAWIDYAARGPARFIVLGDWNRRLAQSRDQVWAELDDGDPQNADLQLADAGTKPRCDPRYDSFIDHIVLDKRAGEEVQAFAEVPYPVGGKHYSDHCPVVATITG